MVYDPNKMQGWSEGRNVTGNNFWNYSDTATPIATLVAANFFDPVNEGNPSPLMRIGDLIWLVASDVLDGELAQVTAIAPHVTIAVFDAILGVGAVGNANLAANAVTTDKILDGTILAADIAAHVLDSSVLALNTIQYVQVPVTAAQFAAAYGAPFIMIAAPGANKIIVIDEVMIEMEFVAAQYTAGGATALQYDNTVHGAGVLATATVDGATVDGWAADTNHVLQGALSSGPNATTANKGIYLSNDTAAFATGDSTFNINIWYHVVSVTA
jgi:hypothetical protein